MLLTVERVTLLRHVDLFSATPGRVLAGMADVLEEVELPAGATLAQAGALEDSLCVVVDGEVEVLSPGWPVRMGPGTVLGEMAVLDPLPRPDTVTALTPVHALRLRRAAFDEVLHTRPEIAAGVIAALVGRLRRIPEPRQSAP